MKKHLLSSVALLALLGGSAIAADLPAKVAPPPVCTTCNPTNWSGFYIGGNVGGSIGRGRAQNNVSLFPPGGTPGVTNPLLNVDDTRSPVGAVAGGQIGFNWQAGNWVLGVEGDWDWTSQRDHLNVQNFIASTVVVAPAQMNYSEEQKLKWLATARARLGWARDAWLWYVTGGAAWGKVDSNYAFQVTGLTAGGTTVFGTGPAAASLSATKSGWTVGGGVETSFGTNWSAKLEYLYVDLGSVNNSFTVPVTATPTTAYTVTSSSQIRDHIIRAGLNYRFGGAAVVARN